ncbi:hypothetical protein BDZ91DRAFT_795558 [Kalaharituber pfeilii]|nr:hypothetical protein BDZ91DRAFT_795558 [Kalaharituber pfeilii]
MSSKTFNFTFNPNDDPNLLEQKLKDTKGQRYQFLGIGGIAYKGNHPDDIKPMVAKECRSHTFKLDGQTLAATFSKRGKAEQPSRSSTRLPQINISMIWLSRLRKWQRLIKQSRSVTVRQSKCYGREGLWLRWALDGTGCYGYGGVNTASRGRHGSVYTAVRNGYGAYIRRIRRAATRRGARSGAERFTGVLRER